MHARTRRKCHLFVDGKHYNGTSVYLSDVPTKDGPILFIDVQYTPPGVEPQSDAVRLALAVLEGDTDAALVLADEVQMQHRQGPDYLPRQALVDALRPLANMPLGPKASPIQRFAIDRDVRRAVEVIDHEERVNKR